MAPKRVKVTRAAPSDNDGDENGSVGHISQIGGYEHPKAPGNTHARIEVKHGPPPKKGKDGFTFDHGNTSVVHVPHKMAGGFKVGQKVRVGLQPVDDQDETLPVRQPVPVAQTVKAPVPGKGGTTY